MFVCVKISENFPLNLFDDETGMKLRRGNAVAIIPTLPATYEISFEVMMTSWAPGRGWHSILHLQNKASFFFQRIQRIQNIYLVLHLIHKEKKNTRNT